MERCALVYAVLVVTSPAATDQFCYGPCLAETHFVLDCVEHSLSTFVFYNKATINDIRSTLQAACGHTHRRGTKLTFPFLTV